MRTPEVSISTAFDYKVPIEKQVPLVAAAGFTHISLGERIEHSDYLSPDGRIRLRDLLTQYNLRIDTIHGPRADQPANIEALTRVADAAYELGAFVVVVHGGPFDFKATELPTRLDTLRRTCAGIDKVPEQTGIVFALENVLPGPATDLVRQILPELNPKHFGFCYDSSHDQIGGPKPFDLLTELGNRVLAVHLSDRIREFVDHVIPGEGFIDWTTLTDLIKQTKFSRPILLEVLTTYSPEAEKGIQPFLKLAHESGVQLYQGSNTLT